MRRSPLGFTGIFQTAKAKIINARSSCAFRARAVTKTNGGLTHPAALLAKIGRALSCKFGHASADAYPICFIPKIAQRVIDTLLSITYVDEVRCRRRARRMLKDKSPPPSRTRSPRRRVASGAAADCGTASLLGLRILNPITTVKYKLMTWNFFFHYAGFSHLPSLLFASETPECSTNATNGRAEKTTTVDIKAPSEPSE